ncbi:MAG: hypothetical protein EU530_09465 [Promethearchaeota archaeon]|nr:MAG: hypothetical protein EU530_09465 [Candidatus Lokiarchaeota archaeon]
MPPRKRDKKIESETTYLRIPDTSKPPSADGVNDYTVLSLNTDSTRSREFDRITELARERVYRKSLILLRKERNLLNAVQYEQLGQIDIAIACYERAANFAERLELFEESEVFRGKIALLGKMKRKTTVSKKKKKREKDSSQYSKQDLESKSILPKGVTIPIVDKEVAKKFKESRKKPEEEDENLF